MAEKLCNLIGHGPVEIDAEPVPESDCMVCRERKFREALSMGLLIWDEYMSQIGNCVSQDYARLNEFPILCSELGIRLPEVRNERKQANR